MGIYFRGTGEKGQILKGTNTILGNREHKKANFRFLGTGLTGNRKLVLCEQLITNSVWAYMSMCVY